MSLSPENDATYQLFDVVLKRSGFPLLKQMCVDKEVSTWVHLVTSCFMCSVLINYRLLLLFHLENNVLFVYEFQIQYWVFFHSILQDLTVILSTLLPVVCINNDSKEHSDFSVGLKVCICWTYFFCTLFHYLSMWNFVCFCRWVHYFLAKYIILYPNFTKKNLVVP